MELVRTDAVHRADDAAEDMVEAAVGAAVFKGVDVAGFFDHTDLMGVAFAAFANWAQFFVGEVEASLAVVNAVAAVVDGTRETVTEFLRRLQEVVGEAFGTATANAGEAREGVNHFADGVLIGEH